MELILIALIPALLFMVAGNWPLTFAAAFLQLLWFANPVAGAACWLISAGWGFVSLRT